jgi:hypothetical protein
MSCSIETNTYNLYLCRRPKWEKTWLKLLKAVVIVVASISLGIFNLWIHPNTVITYHLSHRLIPTHHHLARTFSKINIPYTADWLHKLGLFAPWIWVTLCDKDLQLLMEDRSAAKGTRSSRNRVLVRINLAIVRRIIVCGVLLLKKPQEAYLLHPR